jgi:hypothetical protein
MTWRHRLRTLVRALHDLSATEWLELLRAQRALLAAQWLKLTRPVGRLVSRSDSARPAASSPARPTPDDVRIAQRLALAVTRVAVHGVFHPQCLVRALALHRMLEARGIAGSRLCIGVRHHGGEFLAHAWVEYGQLVLGDDLDHVQTFAQLPDVQVVRQS